MPGEVMNWLDTHGVVHRTGYTFNLQDQRHYLATACGTVVHTSAAFSDLFVGMWDQPSWWDAHKPRVGIAANVTCFGCLGGK